MKKHLKETRGVSALIAIIVLTAAGLVLASSAAYVGIDIVQTSHRLSKAHEAFAATDACIEHAMEVLTTNQNYTGEVLTLGSATCTITADSDSIRVQTLVGTDFSRDIEISYTRNGTTLRITVWQEKN